MCVRKGEVQNLCSSLLGLFCRVEPEIRLIEFIFCSEFFG